MYTHEVYMNIIHIFDMYINLRAYIYVYVCVSLYVCI